MRVFVLGGTGAIGVHTVPALVEAGHEVTALARTADKADALRRQGASPLAVSLFDRAGLAKAFEGHDAVVNIASALPSMATFVLRRAWRENDRVRIQGSTTVVDAAIDAGVPRLVQESVSMLYPDRGSEWIDETAPPDDFPASRGNQAAEQNAARFTDSGAVGIVLRLGLFIGPGAKHAQELLALARRRVVPVLGRRDSYVSSIHLDDAARAVIAALDAPAGVYNVVDDEPLTKADYADAIAAAVQKRAWIRAPGRAALLFGDRVTSVTRSLRVSNRLFRSTTGWAPRYLSARQAWRATAEALQLTTR